MYSDALVKKLENYDIAEGDKVYILTSPKDKNSKYSYREATIVRIAKNTTIHEKPNENTKHYKAKLRMYETWLNKDECDRCKFTINCKGDHYCREVTRKYLYTQAEFNILEEDIENLNRVHAFKKRQQKELEEYVSTQFKDWNYHTFEDRRKIKKEEN